MKKIILSEQQDKEIRSLIKESLAANTALDGGIKTPDGGSTKIDYQSGNPSESPATTLNKMATLPPSTSTLQGKKVPVETEMNVNGTTRSVTLGAPTDNPTKVESIIISKKQLDEIRLKRLKENSYVVKIKNFLK